MSSVTETSDRKAELLAHLQEETETLTTSDGWQRWLSYAARFHEYSLGNQLRIARQCPDATRVAGYRAWQRLGRQVRRGERAIAILAPSTRTITDDDSGEKRRVVTGFHLAFVFDLAQTDGEPLPELALPDVDGGNQELFDSIIEAAKAQGLTVEIVSKPRGHEGPRGWYEPERKSMTLIDAGWPIASRIRTALHELAHHCDPAVHDSETRHCKDILELVAESAAYIVGTNLGLDMDDASATYLASWGGWAACDADMATHLAEHVVGVAGKLESIAPPRCSPAAIPNGSRVGA